MFGRKKVDVKKILEKIGQFCLVEVTEGGHLFGVDEKKIVTYYGNTKIKEEPFSEELFEQKIEKGIPVKVLEFYPEEFEKMPPNQILLGRLELPRLEIGEEESE